MSTLSSDAPVYRAAAAITAHDSNNLPSGPCNGIYVGGAGVVPVVFDNDTVVNFTAAVGTILPVRAKRVNATNATATLMVALY